MATVAARSAPPPRRSAWWIVHHWAGLKLGLLLSFVLITGTIACIANEIDWLVQPAMRAMPRAHPTASWGAWHAAAIRVPGFTPEEIVAPIEPGFAVRASGTNADGDEQLVHINPWTAQVQGVTSAVTVQNVVRDLHRAMMLPTDWGILLVSALSIPLLLTLATAFKVYKKWWRGFARWPRKMRSPKELRRYVGDLHRLAGLWSLWFIALIGGTGLWYLAEKLGAEAPEPQPLAAVATAALPSADRVDAVVSNAVSRWPHFAVRSVHYEGGRITLHGQVEAILVRDRANQAWSDAGAGNTLGHHDAISMSAHQRLSEAADPLHFGTWGGLPTKLVWFVFGLLLSSLSISGTLICALRVAPPGRRAKAALREMGPGGFAGIALIAAALVELMRL